MEELSAKSMFMVEITQSVRGHLSCGVINSLVLNIPRLSLTRIIHGPAKSPFSSFVFSFPLFSLIPRIPPPPTQPFSLIYFLILNLFSHTFELFDLTVSAYLFAVRKLFICVRRPFDTMFKPLAVRYL